MPSITGSAERSQLTSSVQAFATRCEPYIIISGYVHRVHDQTMVVNEIMKRDWFVDFIHFTGETKH